MNIIIIDKIILRDGVVRYFAEIPSRDFIYTGYLLESFEDVCCYTTPDSSKNIMQIDVVPDQLDKFKDILDELILF